MLIIVDKLDNPVKLCCYRSCSHPVCRASDGSLSLFCGPAHQDALGPPQGPDLHCKVCKRRPAYVEDGYAHAFCDTQCAAASKNPGVMMPRREPSVERIPNGGVCRLAGCTQPVYISAAGIYSEWCCNEHRVKAVQTGKAEACLLCRKLPKGMINGKRSDFCAPRCGISTMDAAPIMLAVDKSHTAYENISHQFQPQWCHAKKTRPRIIRIWKLFGTRELTRRFMKYKVETGRRIGRLGGDSRRRWHGTNRCCRVGDGDNQTRFCDAVGCSICSIMKSYFELARFGQRHNWGRFGSGIYASATSSKADDYVVEYRSPYKALLLTEIIMGNAIILTKDNDKLTAPPPGFDSVVGQPGDDLNYDEAVVYTNDAVRPLFLVIYDDGEVPSSVPRAQR